MSATESPDFRAARRHDAEGRHYEAINLLARATRAGDLAAMSELGHRLMTGDRAPALEEDGVRFIIEAAQGGDPRALARVAAFTAAGAWVTQDWSGSLRLLARAAQAGEPSAQGQLASLQPDEASTAAPDWNGIAARFPFDEWLRPAPTEALHEHVHRVSSLAPASMCRWLIERARGRLERAKVYDSVSRAEMVHEMRSNTVANFNLSNFDVVQLLVQARMAQTCRYPLQHFEAPMVLHYDVGEQITPHFDFIDQKAPDYEQQIREQGQRMVTFLLYLNDDYEGGETTFPDLGLVNRGHTGEGLYFINALPDGKPDRRMVHTGSPPTSGEKWIVSQFIRNIPLRA